MDLRISSTDLQLLRDSLLGYQHERCAVSFATRARSSTGREFLLVRETVFPTDEDYLRSGLDHAQLRPDFVARVAKRARSKDLSLVFIHTHPGESAPRFSHVDDHGEEELAAFFARRGQSVPHGALVMSRGGISARVLGRHEPLRVVSVGDQRVVEFDSEKNELRDFAIYDRQLRAFGNDGQRVLQSLHVAVVGLGGTGSIAAQQLVHLGVGSFTLVDPDKLELSNLNRVVGAFEGDIGRFKTDIAARYIRQFSSDAEVRHFNEDIVYASVARKLLDADVIFCCTDSHGSRSVIQQVAYQYFIPCIDIGSTITAAGGEITGIFGRIQQVGPDQPCLWCSGLLNSEEVRRDMLTEFERKADPYIRGGNVPAPSVISLNATVVSIAVTMFLGLVTSIPVHSRHVIYNATTSSMRSVRAYTSDDCFICSQSGAFGLGDTQDLLARKD